MLVVTEVFIAPPTHGECGREMGERGDGEAFRKRVREEAERQIRGTAGGRYY